MAMSTFFKLFPPPKFLNTSYAGVSISDDAVRCVQFVNGPHGRIVGKYANKPLPRGIVEGGHIMDEAKLTEIVKAIAKELGITFVKAALPEEKVYLFKTQVPNADSAAITQNIEFKLEENVPMPAAEAIFCFEIIPGTFVDGKNTASVLAAPRKAVDAYLNVLTGAGLTVLSFEMMAQALAKSLIPKDSTATSLIVHIMDTKAGIYIVHQGVVCFSSTISLADDLVSTIHKETAKVYDYWSLHGEGKKEVDDVILCGKKALMPGVADNILPLPVAVDMANVWRNAFAGEDYIPPITFDESLDYAVAAGLAL
jgi:Tfp pilus assembly PilM family ATPase